MAIIGLGNMGSSAARRLAGEGFELYLWNRTREKAERLGKELGASVAPSPYEASKDSEVALAFLSDDEAVIQVASSMRRADGLVFANASTITPKTSVYVGSHLESLGVCYVETPVLGGPKVVSEGRALFMVSGRRSCVEVARKVLEPMSSEIIVLGEEWGKASSVKLGLNSMLLSMIAALAESLRLVEEHGVDPNEFFEVLLKSEYFRALAQAYYERMLAESRPPGFRLELAAKDMEYFSRAAYEVKVSSFIASAAGQLYRMAAMKGYGSKDYSQVYRFLKRG